MPEEQQGELMPRVYKVAELAKILQIGINKAYTLVHDKKIRSIKIGREYRIPRQCVEEWLAQRDA